MYHCIIGIKNLWWTLLRSHWIFPDDLQLFKRSFVVICSIYWKMSFVSQEISSFPISKMQSYKKKKNEVKKRREKGIWLSTNLVLPCLFISEVSFLWELCKAPMSQLVLALLVSNLMVHPILCIQTWHCNIPWGQLNWIWMRRNQNK